MGVLRDFFGTHKINSGIISEHFREKIHASKESHSSQLRSADVPP